MTEAEKQKLIDLLKANPFEFKSHEEFAELLIDMGLGFCDEQSDLIIIESYETPWEVANKLINKTIIHKNIYFNTEYEGHFFDKDDLLKIGKHLVNYAETERGNENEA